MRVCGTALDGMHPQPAILTPYCQSLGGTAAKGNPRPVASCQLPVASCLLQATIKIGVDRNPLTSILSDRPVDARAARLACDSSNALLHSTLAPF
jgi:hypothetical protein